MAAAVPTQPALAAVKVPDEPELAGGLPPQGGPGAILATRCTRGGGWAW